ncbi:MAG TPA: hypothetical protein VJI13_00775 [Candidatus Norongarragalinales archaeon]|nr:hypothetical protein [Candidatus Norongarragalinales archaeon]
MANGLGKLESAVARIASIHGRDVGRQERERAIMGLLDASGWKISNARMNLPEPVKPKWLAKNITELGLSGRIRAEYVNSILDLGLRNEHIRSFRALAEAAGITKKGLMKMLAITGHRVKLHKVFGRRRALGGKTRP